MRIYYTLLLLSSFLYAEEIRYYQSSKGMIKLIDLNRFNKCTKIIYRVAGKKELPYKHQKILLRKLIKGETINNLEAVVTVLKKSNEKLCTYGTIKEKFI